MGGGPHGQGCQNGQESWPNLATHHKIKGVIWKQPGAHGNPAVLHPPSPFCCIHFVSDTPDAPRKLAGSTHSLANGLAGAGGGGAMALSQRKRLLHAPTLAELDSSESDVSQPSPFTWFLDRVIYLIFIAYWSHVVMRVGRRTWRRAALVAPLLQPQSLTPGGGRVRS